MQTFLPFPDFRRSAAVLDQRRLGKQRVEALQVFRGLTVPGYGWRRHPAVRMWSGYEEALVRYGLEICGAWTAEGRVDTCAGTLMEDFLRWRPGGSVRVQKELARARELPVWLGSAEFHLSHRSALVRKDPGFYRPLFADIPEDLPYIWPASDRESGVDGA
ncbi:MSMEG_6728 family protein [Streptomyces sp. NPDC006530]|uniref:MSMEG_6728 family protein n=1 Tax=Streptomyces sp. NPDC006530 TaxID=3364750 RepID=UPI003697B689